MHCDTGHDGHYCVAPTAISPFVPWSLRGLPCTIIHELGFSVANLGLLRVLYCAPVSAQQQARLVLLCHFIMVGTCPGGFQPAEHFDLCPMHRVVLRTYIQSVSGVHGATQGVVIIRITGKVLYLFLSGQAEGAAS